MASHLSTPLPERHLDGSVLSANGHDLLSRTRFKPDDGAPRRTAPYEQEPGYYALGRLWLHGNVRLMDCPLAYVGRALGPPTHTDDDSTS